MSATVLAYHAVGEPPVGADPHSLFVPTRRFAEQLAFLARRRRVVPLSDVVGDGPAARDRHAVALTFDDAYRHLLTTALPLLEQHGFPSTVFVPTAWTGRRNGWDEPTAADLTVMDDAELREADRRGMRVESHGHAHLDCRTAAVASVEADLRASRQRLVDVLDRAPRYLAWPYRDGSPAARAVAERLGFQAAFSIDLPDAGPFSAARVQVTPGDGRRLFALKTSGRYLALRHSPVPAAAYRAAKPLLRR
jgi:peptidoglycan/xylan/chitin deacetylase (PgdA/CDA1 family)